MEWICKFLQKLKWQTDISTEAHLYQIKKQFALRKHVILLQITNTHTLDRVVLSFVRAARSSTSLPLITRLHHVLQIVCNWWFQMHYVYVYMLGCYWKYQYVLGTEIKDYWSDSGKSIRIRYTCRTKFNTKSI